jgi:hypothetical protein
MADRSAVGEKSRSDEKAQGSRQESGNNSEIESGWERRKLP